MRDSSPVNDSPAAGGALNSPPPGSHQLEGLGTVRKGTAMTQIRITKRRRPDDWRLEPLPLDPRDPDIVRAKELARRARTEALGQGHTERPGR